ncbi:HAD domain-containing protein [Arthrobacter pascens]|uniref:HAD domain-containing protein n=1 Tax=Arthrobacter pascens TaxID=1677 RepID=UPI0027D7D038|nr:HAD domain-containing protein [Arthrobacter pascens]
MKLLILLDIDGVLNPVARAAGPGGEPELVLSETRIALVRRLAALGRIAWVSTWPAEQRAGLERQLQLPLEPLRVPLSGSLSESDAATPKLRPVSRWLKKMELLGEAEWDAVVWIDDVLGPDAREWAHQYNQPVLLERPSPAQGLTEVHVVAVEVFVDGDGG